MDKPLFPNGATHHVAPLFGQASDACCGPATLDLPVERGSRRRRIWELDGHAHCPVVGVCLPLALARRLANKVLGGEALADDYELHCGVVTDCKRRSKIAEAVQRSLDERHAGSVRLAAACKSEEALATWWQARSQGAGLPGALWAVLTHPHCSTRLEDRVLGEVHMRQHQLGHADRADHSRLSELEAENARLKLSLAEQRERQTQQADQSVTERDRLQTELVRVRGLLLTRDALMAQVSDELQQLKAAAPDLPSRRALAEQVQHQAEQLSQLRRALSQAQDALASRPTPVIGATPAPGQATQTSATPPEPTAADTLADAAASAAALSPAADGSPRTVLCVGGRTAAVPVYRRLIEDLGARFEHHDGGQEHHFHRLQAGLQAADLVICQAGCVSHDAYWRVKAHCKRTGKPCVFVDTPSASRLKQALADVMRAPASAQAQPQPGTTATTANTTTLQDA